MAGSPAMTSTVGFLTSSSPTTTLLRSVPLSLKGFGWEENRNYRALYRCEASRFCTKWSLPRANRCASTALRCV